MDKDLINMLRDTTSIINDYLKEKNMSHLKSIELHIQKLLMELKEI